MNQMEAKSSMEPPMIVPAVATVFPGGDASSDVGSAATPRRAKAFAHRAKLRPVNPRTSGFIVASPDFRGATDAAVMSGGSATLRSLCQWFLKPHGHQESAVLNEKRLQAGSFSDPDGRGVVLSESVLAAAWAATRGP
jgi:hypothetical protein